MNRSDLAVRFLRAFSMAVLVFLPAGVLAGQVPCTDPRGCPDLVTDATTMDPKAKREKFSESDCAVLEGATKAGRRTLLRFTFTTPNLGPGDLIVGKPGDHPEWFEWSPCHGHYHFREYADYRLWTPSGHSQWEALRQASPTKTAAEVLAENPALESEFVSGHKQGFCVIDVRRYGGTEPARYTACADQGITVGWADEYHAKLDGQWVDVTDVAAGTYVLEAEVNAERLYGEADYGNNRAHRTVTL